MTAPLLAVDNLQKAYRGVRAVRGISFTMAAGEILALIGPNGAGKSTCFNLLNGQIRPDSGTVRLKGADVTAFPPQARWAAGVGRTFQITATFPSMTVRENVAVGLLSHARAIGRVAGSLGMQAEADVLLALVDLAAQAERPCGELAYGDLKRLELAMALTNAPALLLMDEPTAGMAPAERSAVMAATIALARERGIGVLFTEHDVDVVFGHAERVIVMDRGTLIANGPPADVRPDPAVRAVYLGQDDEAERP